MGNAWIWGYCLHTCNVWNLTFWKCSRTYLLDSLMIAMEIRIFLMRAKRMMSRMRNRRVATIPAREEMQSVCFISFSLPPLPATLSHTMRVQTHTHTIIYTCTQWHVHVYTCTCIVHIAAHTQLNTHTCRRSLFVECLLSVVQLPVVTERFWPLSVISCMMQKKWLHKTQLHV